MGGLDRLAVARNDRQCVVAPFPLAMRPGQAVVQARPGARYQLLVDGHRVIEVHSTREDPISLD